MNNKRAVMITAIIIVMLSLSIVAIYCGYSYYRERMAQKYEIHPSPYTIEDIQNSNAAYLLDPNLVITEDNVQSVLDDYFSAPARLSFTVLVSVKLDDMEEIEYVCDDLNANAKFGNMFQNQIIHAAEEDVGVMVEQGANYLFINDIGEIHFSCINGRTYLYFQRFAFPNQGFIIEEETIEEIEAAIESALPYSMEIFAMG